MNIPWSAFSRGFHPSSGNTGAISSHTIEALSDRGIVVDGPRNPMRLCVEDLEEADLIIAVKETEHRPMAEASFPEYVEQIIFWQVHDVDAASPQEALPLLENLLKDLLEKLPKGSDDVSKS